MSDNNSNSSSSATSDVMEIDFVYNDDNSTQPLDLSSHTEEALPVNRQLFPYMISLVEHESGLNYILGQEPTDQNLIEIERRRMNSDEARNLESDDRVSPTVSVGSSRTESPYIFPEESNQSSTNEPIRPTTTNTITVTTPEKKSSSSCSTTTINDELNEDDGTLCPICLDNWTSTGDHRICSLKCGHLFGYKCVNRWLQSESRKTCPTCKKRVSKGDLRYIYAKKLIAIDTSELDNMRKQLNFVIEERNRAQMELAQYTCREHLLNQEIAYLKSQLNYKKNDPSTSLINNNYNKVNLYMDKSIEICKHGGSRVFDANCNLDLLIASIKSQNNLFNGFGLKKLCITNYKPIAFIPVHRLQIRDICFHRENNWVLTASMDKTFKVVDNISNTITHHFHHQMPLWSCCWDINNTNILYVGTQSGSVIKYDLRQLNEPVNVLSIEDDMSPVVSIASVPSSMFNSNSTSLNGNSGVISCKLSSLWIFDNTYNNTDYKRYPLALEGPFISMKYQENTKQLLVSSRPNSRTSYSRHTLCTLEKKLEDDKIKCNIIHSFQGGGMQKLLSKSCFLTSNNQYVAAHLENTKSVYLWSINSGEKVTSVPAHETVLDLKGIQNNNGDYLVSLTEKRLEFFKFL